MINIISSCGFTEHTHLSRTKRDVCGLPRNLIWNNGGHKFGGYLTMEPVSFPWGTINGGRIHRIRERSALSINVPVPPLLLRWDSRGRGRQGDGYGCWGGGGGAFNRREEWDWVDVVVVPFFSTQTQSQCGIINGGTQTKHILVRAHGAKYVCVCLCVYAHACVFYERYWSTSSHEH